MSDTGLYQVYYNLDPNFREDKCLTWKKVLDPSRFAHVGSYLADSLDEVYEHYQAENWSPNGEGKDLAQSLDLVHMSMSVGDVIVTEDGFFYQVASLGFTGVTL